MASADRPLLEGMDRKIDGVLIRSHAILFGLVLNLALDLYILWKI